MLNTLSQRLSRVIKTMRGQARLTEENTRDMLREVRIALLEADVALPVVRELIARIKTKAMNEEVIGNLNPGQALVGVVQRELTDIIGGSLSEKEKEINSELIMQIKDMKDLSDEDIKILKEKIKEVEKERKEK